MSTAVRKQVPSLAEQCREQAEKNLRQAEQLNKIMNGRTPAERLALFVESAFEGSNVLVNVGAARTVDEAEQAILAAIDACLDTPLNIHQRAKVGAEVGLYWNKRAQMRRALLAETQKSLANPFFAIGGR